MKTSSEISIPTEIDLVSFNVPFPPDYGGVIDVFYKIKAMSDLGIKVNLHCFEYGRGMRLELNKYCESVSYYKRCTGVNTFFSSLPNIVASRNSNALVEKLLTGNRPILLEGIHCTLPLLEPRMEGRKVVIRSHNLEHNYYNGLAKSSRFLGKRLFYYQEAKKLRNFEPVVERASAIACISEPDRKYFIQNYSVRAQTITPFHRFDSVNSHEGIGDYVLIHGDLSVSENQKSIEWLVDEVVSKVHFWVVVAGKNPPKNFLSNLAKYKNIRVISNPSGAKIDELIANAQVNLIHSFYPQGFKLKLLHSLFGGRFCICNAKVVEETGLEAACIVANSSQDFIRSIHAAFETSFSAQMIEQRKEVLLPFSNEVQARKLAKLLSI